MCGKYGKLYRLLCVLAFFLAFSGSLSAQDVSINSESSPPKKASESALPSPDSTSSMAEAFWNSWDELKAASNGSQQSATAWSQLVDQLLKSSAEERRQILKLLEELGVSVNKIWYEAGSLTEILPSLKVSVSSFLGQEAKKQAALIMENLDLKKSNDFWKVTGIAGISTTVILAIVFGISSAR